MAKMDYKQKKKIIEEWKKRNGAADFDLKNHDVILYDGGLFSIESKKVKRHKIVGYKDLPDGSRQIIFAKKATIRDVNYEATFWFEELNETINYFRRMRDMLNSIGYKTGPTKKDIKNLKKKYGGKK